MRCSQIDVWKKEREKQNEAEVEEEMKQTTLYEKQLEIQRLKRERYELEKLFCSIHELCTRRVQKLEKQGYRPETVEDPIETGLLKTAQNDVDSYKETTVSRRKRKEWLSCEAGVMLRIGGGEEEENDEEYYYGMHHNINKLVAIRWGFLCGYDG